MDRYIVSCAELRGAAQSLSGEKETLMAKIAKIQKAIDKATRGDHNAADLTDAYAAKRALNQSIARLGEICSAMDMAAGKFADASAELSARANLTAYYMQHTDTLSYEGLMGAYSSAILSTGSAAAGYEVVKNTLSRDGYAVNDLGSVYNATNAPNSIHEVPASGYAELCNLAYGAAKDKKDPSAAFAEAIRNSKYIPDDSQLKYITASQVSYYTSPSGLACFVIGDGENATVIFVGTNGVMDLVADAQLTFSVTSAQVQEARYLMEQVTKKYDNVVVTGHSLGGHLATDVTLNNKKVDQCIAFEAPGRYDLLYHQLFNEEQHSKIKTYNASGSIISSVGGVAGDEVNLDVDPSGKWVIDRNHSIKNVRNKLSEEEKSCPPSQAW